MTFNGQIGALLLTRCGRCHGENGVQVLNLTTYEGITQGSVNGAVLIPGDPTNSSIIQKQTAELPHFAQFSADEIQLMIDWINAGAPEE